MNNNLLSIQEFINKINLFNNFDQLGDGEYGLYHAWSASSIINIKMYILHNLSQNMVPNIIDCTDLEFNYDLPIMTTGCGEIITIKNGKVKI